MFRNSLQPKFILKNTLAALLMITLSGAYCLFCCQEILAAVGKAAHQTAGKAVQTEHCNFSKNESSGTSKAANADAFECCGLKFNFFVAKLVKKEFPQKTPASANNFSVFPESAELETNAGCADFFYRAPIDDSRDLHVKNCVFRI